MKHIVFMTTLLVSLGAWAEQNPQHPTCDKMVPSKYVAAYKVSVHIEVPKADYKSINTEQRLARLEGQKAIPEVARITKAVNEAVQLKYGNYDSVAFATAIGNESFRPLPGSAGEPITGKVARYTTVVLSFSIPQKKGLLDKVVKAIHWNHSYEEPVIEVTNGLTTRTVPDFLKDGRCDASPHKWWR